MLLVKDPRKIFIILVITLLLIYAVLRIKPHKNEAYYQRRIEDQSEISDVV